MGDYNVPHYQFEKLIMRDRAPKSVIFGEALFIHRPMANL